MTDNLHRELDMLTKVALVLLALQTAVFAKMWMDLGFDRASHGFPVLIMGSALFVRGQRWLIARPPNRGAARWIFASRAAALSLLAFGTLLIAFYRLVPNAARPDTFAVQGMFVLMWSIVALKGAAMGKLKPGSSMGLCVTWTKQSRLAWDKGHRALGRVLFWGGLIGLASSLIVPPLTVIAMWAGTIALAVTFGLVESWRAWRLDPERSRGRAA